MIVTVHVPNLDPQTVFTEAAVAGLVGQQPRMTIAFDWTRSLGKATVVGARLCEDGFDLDLDLGADDLEITQEMRNLIRAAVVDDEDTPMVSIGYTVEQRADDHVDAATVREFCPGPLPPAFPAKP